MTYLARFGRFLYDFLIGGAWELFIGPLLALAMAWVLIRAGLDPAVAGTALVVAVLAVIALHLGIALRHAA